MSSIRNLSKILDVSCEETNIQQVFLNIITNAAHAIGANRENIDVPTITLRVKRDGGMACVEIEDNGCGIEPEIRKRIFEPFYTTKGVGRGTGLGLSISYFIVNDQHNGSLEVRSEPGKGSVLSFVCHLSRMILYPLVLLCDFFSDNYCEKMQIKQLCQRDEQCKLYMPGFFLAGMIGI